MAEPLKVNGNCSIPDNELQWRFTSSGGPGGQHANRSRTKAEVRFDVNGSEALTESQRRRLVDKLGEVVIATADDERSQARNRALALDRLRGRLAEGLATRRTRRPTKPTRGSKRRRLDAKRRQSQKKSGRQKPAQWD